MSNIQKETSNQAFRGITTKRYINLSVIVFIPLVYLLIDMVGMRHGWGSVLACIWVIISTFANDRVRLALHTIETDKTRRVSTFYSGAMGFAVVSLMLNGLVVFITDIEVLQYLYSALVFAIFGLHVNLIAFLVFLLLGSKSKSRQSV